MDNISNTGRIGLALALGLLSAAPGLAADQELSAETVVSRAIEALGGQAAWDSVETMTLRGSFATYSSAQPFVIHRKRPNLYLFEHNESGQDVTIGFDGTKAWWQSGWIPFSEVNWPTAPPVAYSRGFEADAEFVFPFLDYRERGHRVELVTTGDFEGTPSHELLIELSAGTSERWYFDAVSFLPLARSSRAGYTVFEVEQMTFFTDFREVADILVPHHVESELGNRLGVMVVESVEINSPIEDTVFEMPKPPVLDRLSQLAGRWRVETASRHPQPSLPWMHDQSVATFRALYDGRALEEEVTLLFYGRPYTVKRIYTYDRFRDSIRIVQVDSLTTHPILLDGRWTDEGLTASNLETGTGWNVLGQDRLNRLVLHDLKQDEFVIDLDYSFDGGATWTTLATCEYHREATAGATAPAADR